MKRRPERLIRWRNSLGRRVIEPESSVSSSCVGDQFWNLKRRLTEKMPPQTPQSGRDNRIKPQTLSPNRLTTENCLSRPGDLHGDRCHIVVKGPHSTQGLR